MCFASRLYSGSATLRHAPFVRPHQPQLTGGERLRWRLSLRHEQRPVPRRRGTLRRQPALFGILKPDRLLPFLLGHSRQIISCTVFFLLHLPLDAEIIKINEWCERVYTPVQMGTQTIKITCGLTRICCHIGHKPEGIGSPIHDRNTIAGRVIPMVMAREDVRNSSTLLCTDGVPAGKAMCSFASICATTAHQFVTNPL